MTRRERIGGRLGRGWDRLGRWGQLAAWAAAVAAAFGWFRWTSLPPSDRWITLGVMLSCAGLAAVMLAGTGWWLPRGLGLLSMFLAVAGLMHLLAARRFAWMPPFEPWMLDLVRALLVVAVVLLAPSVPGWLRERRARDGADGGGAP